MLITEHARTHRHTHTNSLSKFHEYSWLHKLCSTSANSRQTFSQNAHEADPLSLSPFYCILYSILSLSLSSLSVSPPSPSTLLSQHHHLSYLLSFSLSLSFPSQPLSLSLSIISVLPLLPPHRLFSPEDTDPYGML